MWNGGHFKIMRDSPQIITLNDKLQSTLADGYADTCGQTHPPLPLQGTVPLSWVTPSSRFQVCDVMKTHMLLACAVGHPSPPAFPWCARFKGKVMEHVSADVVPPPAGPAPELWEHPNPMPAGKSYSRGTAGGNWVCLKQGGMPYVWPKY